jgi:hypothetical protein
MFVMADLHGFFNVSMANEHTFHHGSCADVLVLMADAHKVSYWVTCIILVVHSQTASPAQHAIRCGAVVHVHFVLGAEKLVMVSSPAD